MLFTSYAFGYISKILILVYVSCIKAIPLPSAGLKFLSSDLMILIMPAPLTAQCICFPYSEHLLIVGRFYKWCTSFTNRFFYTLRINYNRFAIREWMMRDAA